MGLRIDRDHFTDGELRLFADRLEQALTALGDLLARPGFGEGPPSIGAELETSLVGEDGTPVPRNRTVLADADDPRLTEELCRFNLELNLSYGPLAGAPFTRLAEEAASLLRRVDEAAARHGAATALIGIVPTLTADDLTLDNLTPAPRYSALNIALRRLRESTPFRIRIDGEDPLMLDHDDVAPEGANTSWQVHLRVPPAAFDDVFNAAQLATVPVLAASANSPTFLGHRLWHETRIALFKQAVDDRPPTAVGTRTSRVAFGTGWVSGGPLAAFRDVVALHRPLLGVVSQEDAVRVAASGAVPALDELRLHGGTVWRWNRPVFDPADDGHVRVELRSLPSGPTVRDMVANTAFLIGLVRWLSPRMARWCRTMPFGLAEDAFYRAAQLGLDAEVWWPDAAGQPVRRGARDLATELLPMAREGLDDAGVDSAESGPLLDVVADRLASGVTGAVWQRQVLGIPAPADREEAMRRMFRHYRQAAATGAPVHRWDLPT